MTTHAQPESVRRLAELEARTRAAWTSYSENLAGLEGRAYEDAEIAYWDRLQATLFELDSERSSLVPG